MKRVFLEFEQPIAELVRKVDELKLVQNDSSIDISDEIQHLEKKIESVSKSIFSKLTPVQILQISRHPHRPCTLDYIKHLFSDFEELHGDRMFADDYAIVGGLAKYHGENVVVIGHQKGHDTKEKIMRNFGMPKPEGYRKSLRLMKLAEKFSLPLITFIDTSGAYPGIGAEERGQSEAIGRNLLTLAKLRVPVICNIIGEGGSGGALALGVGDYINMLEFATYSVITPEGCASILWKSAERSDEAANALGITSKRLKELKLVDYIIREPLGGAHRDYKRTMEIFSETLEQQWKSIRKIEISELLEKRFNRLMEYGNYAGK